MFSQCCFAGALIGLREGKRDEELVSCWQAREETLLGSRIRRARFRDVRCRESIKLGLPEHRTGVALLTRRHGYQRRRLRRCKEKDEKCSHRVIDLTRTS